VTANEAKGVAVKRNRGYRVLPFSRSRRMMAASLDAYSQPHAMHAIIEADITEPRRLMRDHRERTGQGLSLTAYVVTCLARAVAEYPYLNSMHRGRKLYVFDDVAIITNVDRSPQDERIVEVLSIRAADKKTFRQIHEEIRAAQRRRDEPAGSLSGATWVGYVPTFLLRRFFRLVSRNVRWARHFGVVLVSNVGMFGDGPGWGVPSGGPTLAVTVGGIAKRPVMVEGRLKELEHLCLTLSFDHDIIDGAPAASFTSRFSELLSSGDALREAVAGGGSEGS
jgi:pyruvate/2-oxoglutarate dehydrogenase complex dihydrolipoamide acyltransferase (E2) component